jgi:hypothetical protein
MPKAPVDFAGPSYFGGKDDQLIVCAGKGRPPLPLLKRLIDEKIANAFIHIPCTAGDIHIWDRESGALLHHVRAQVVGGDLTCVAWNPAADPFMFATGSHDGAVRIWTTLDRSALPSPYPEFTFQSEGGGYVSGTPRTRSPSLYRPESDSRLGLSNAEGGSRAHDLRASLDEVGAQLRVHRSPSLYRPESDSRLASSNTEGGLKAHDLRASLDELGAQLKTGGRS